MESLDWLIPLVLGRLLPLLLVVTIFVLGARALSSSRRGGRPMKGGSPGGHSIGATQHQSPNVATSAKSRGVYIILGILLGLLGIHNFYAGYYGKGAAQLATTILGLTVIIGPIITGIWVLIELFTVREDAAGNVMAL